jgi:hypothetical protein
MFKGNAMTYYGRWTYKYEIASEKGAAAAIIVHETGPAGYPYEVVSGSWGRENFDIQTPDKNMNRVAVESWITTDRAKELFAAGGQDFDALKKAAVSKDFKPVALNAKPISKSKTICARSTRTTSSPNSKAPTRAQKRVRRLLGALGSSGARSEVGGRSDLQRRA